MESKRKKSDSRLLNEIHFFLAIGTGRLSQRICTCTDHPNAFKLAQVASAKEHSHLHISSSIYTKVPG